MKSNPKTIAGVIVLVILAIALGFLLNKLFPTIGEVQRDVDCFAVFYRNSEIGKDTLRKLRVDAGDGAVKEFRLHHVADLDGRTVRQRCLGDDDFLF